MLITPAQAQAAGSGGSGMDFYMQLLMFVPIIAIFYFLIFRPQQQRMKQHKSMVSGVRRGDTVVTSGGIVGKVSRVIEEDGKEAELEVQIAENVKVRVVRSTIADVRKAKEAEEKAA
jgi:preprotein translocase subunit YajC